jgi:hypothetical protein
MRHGIGGPQGPSGVADGGGYYWQQNRDGKSVFFSVRDTLNVPRATLEVSIHEEHATPMLMQIQGVENEEIEGAERMYIRSLMEGAGLLFNTDGDGINAGGEPMIDEPDAHPSLLLYPDVSPSVRAALLQRQYPALIARPQLVDLLR